MRITKDGPDSTVPVVHRFQNDFPQAATQISRRGRTWHQGVAAYAGTARRHEAILGQSVRRHDDYGRFAFHAAEQRSEHRVGKSIGGVHDATVERRVARGDARAGWWSVSQELA
jgi:hypothetical protein